MFVCEDKYDVIVIGGGHAGCEAALASAKLGAKTLLLTQSLDTVAQMSCNPSIGGIAKGQIVREIDALGGAMGRVTDCAALHYHMLNTGKGPAVHSPRVQCDKKIYQFTFKHFLELQPNLDIMQDEAVKISTSDNGVNGVLTLRNTFYHTKTVVLTTGTFLAGTIHIGTEMFKGGRYNDMPSDGLAKNLREELHLHMLRFKTGTPMRINARGLDYSKFRLQPSDNPLQPISHFTDVKAQQQRRFLSCHITRTTLETDKILRNNFQRSAMYSGNIHGMGPRYCPSVEDKIKKFPDVTSHPLFLEPEGFHTEEYYIQGFSTSMPEDVQRALIKSVPGMEKASITRPGYAVEYDFSDPRDLFPSLESKLVPNLFLGGQINGTTGYEEAGGQGLIAGINAALKTLGKEPFVLRRDEAYIGVLIDDLVNKGVNEPYRMFTSRAEYRILLRQDDADMRLTPRGFEIGLASRERYDLMLGKKRQRDALVDFTRNFSVKAARINPFLEGKGLSPLRQSVKLYDLILRPQLDIFMLAEAIGPLAEHIAGIEEQRREEIVESAEILIKYQGYIDRERLIAEKISRLEHVKLRGKIVYADVKAISTEARQKLTKIDPETVAQASRIPGISPSDINILLLLLGR